MPGQGLASWSARSAISQSTPPHPDSSSHPAKSPPPEQLEHRFLLIAPQSNSSANDAIYGPISELATLGTLWTNHLRRNTVPCDALFYVKNDAHYLLLGRQNLCRGNTTLPQLKLRRRRSGLVASVLSRSPESVSSASHVRDSSLLLALAVSSWRQFLFSRLPDSIHQPHDFGP
jgi:hypothetical protein